MTASIPGTGLSYSTSLSKKNYRSSAYRQRNELAKIERELNRLEEMKKAAYEVELFINKIDLLKSIHKESDDQINWSFLKDQPEPFIKGGSGIKQKNVQSIIDNYKPNFIQKLFKLDIKKLEQLNKQLQQAKLADIDDYETWEMTVALSKLILSGDTDAYLSVIDQMAPLEDLNEFGSGFKFFVSDDPTIIGVEFEVNSKNVIPTQTKLLTKTGKVSVKDMTKSQYFDLEQDYVCSCTIRIARDMFTLLPIENVVIHAMDNKLNSSTGHLELTDILSVIVDRKTLMNLNFETIDCSDSIKNFIHNMNFKKTRGFTSIQRVFN